jgi:uracil-DNA glycosylase family 4
LDVVERQLDLPVPYPADVVTGGDELGDLSAAIVACRRCPRLVSWREDVARVKRAAYRNEEYWGNPIPGWGDPSARVVVIGLAPAAHGANRTGRMFTGDRSGEWLYRALWRAGFANQPTSTGREDGLELSDVWVTAPVRCAPPANRPTPAERDACATWFDAELRLLPEARVFVVLGDFAYRALWSHLKRRGVPLPSPRPRFAHGAEVPLESGSTVIASFHPSQQNTFTGRLSEGMLDAVFSRAAALSER